MIDVLSERIKEKLVKKGTSLIGFADLNDIQVKDREDIRYGISIGVALNPRIVNGIETGPTKEYYSEYLRINNLLDELDEYAVDILKSHGYNAISKSTKVVKQYEDSLSTILPHKTVATRAGLGWIGKCALLITEGFGSAVRLSTVLTDAELEFGIPVNESKCGECNECVKYCLGDAVNGVNWDVKMDRDVYYNAYKCSEAARRVSKEVGIQSRLCGKCIVVCPWTKRYVKRG